MFTNAFSEYGPRPSPATVKPRPLVPRIGRRLRDWQLHQAHSDCRPRHHLLHSATPAGTRVRHPARTIHGDGESDQGTLLLRVSRYRQGIRQVRHRPQQVDQNLQR